mgnify:CR=1 FL=1
MVVQSGDGARVLHEQNGPGLMLLVCGGGEGSQEEVLAGVDSAGLMGLDSLEILVLWDPSD